MEEGMLWRTGVMEGPCAVTWGKDINIRGLLGSLHYNTHNTGVGGMGAA
jgi:hypothetical protein